MKYISFVLLIIICSVCCTAQQTNTFRKQYDAFKQEKYFEYDGFRRKANNEYVEFMRKAWVWYQANPSFLMPLHPDPPLPVPLSPDLSEVKDIPKKLLPYEMVIVTPSIIEQAEPIAPVKETLNIGEIFHFKAYGTEMKVRLSNKLRYNLRTTSENDVANQWMHLSNSDYNNLLYDCLALRSQYNLCDWAYLNVLEQLAEAFLGKQSSEVALLQAFLFNQSGYKVRLGRSKTNRLYVMVASQHQIYNMSYFNLKGDCFYPFNYKEDGLYIYDNAFPKEQQMSLIVGREQLFMDTEVESRTLCSKGEYRVQVTLSFNKNLIDFYNTYPQSSINNDGTTKWTFYANTPLSEIVRKKLYPVLRTAISGKSERDAANILINFVQTALIYGYDDEIWGGDRPFFADETLYYPYSDCEDRAILYSRLVRDLLHLETVLLYYPGHLAMAICFNEKVGGKSFLIQGKTYTYCEPTCTGYAPIGWCPKDLETIPPKVVLLND